MFAQLNSTLPATGNTEVQAASDRTSIVLVDDDVELCSLVSGYLKLHGYECRSFHDGSSGLAAVLEIRCDLVILDLMLPVIDGFELLRQVRRISPVPIIMLTARSDAEDRIGCLNTGADDYLSKPFAPEELLARISAVLRRTRQAHFSKEEVTLAGIRLNTCTREVWMDERAIRLTTIEFDILDLLMHSAGRIVSRDEIAAILNHRVATARERSVDVHICHLRRKLEPRAALIKTVRSTGYLFGTDA